MAGILTGEGTVCCGSLFGVRGIVFLTNGDQFCLFQNTIFRLNSRDPVRMFGNQRLTKTENEF